MSEYRVHPLAFAVHRMLMSLLLTMAVVGCAGAYMGIWQVGAGHVFVAVVLTGLFTWCNYGKSNEKILSALAILGVLFLVIPMLSDSPAGELISDYIKWLAGAEGYRQEWLKGYELLQVSWVSLICYLVTIPAEKSLLIKGIISFALIALCGVVFIMAMPAQKFFVAITILYVLAYCAEVIQRFWKKQGSKDTRMYLLYLMPFFALYLGLMLIMPHSEEPYDWKLFRDIYANVSENLTMFVDGIVRSSGEDFGGAVSGFSEDGKLAFNISSRSRDLMVLTGDRNLYTNVYLTGKIYDTFDGREWSKDTAAQMSPEIDTLELIYAVRNYDPELMSNYFYKNVLKVQYKFFHTNYLFAPTKWVAISETRKQIEGEEVHFERKAGYGTKYDITYYQLNLNADCFKQLLREDVEEIPDNWDYIRYHYGNPSWAHLTLKDLEDHRENVKAKYGQAPAASETAMQYAELIFAECETDYDKMKALEIYLSAMEYTVSPGKLPEWVNSQEDFLDYFLTEGRKGYCSYFATAFVLMARQQGLPARYVEGFCVPLAKDKNMVVTTEMTHAWPEVYFEGVGWIPFEPTPGYAQMRYSGWKTKAPKKDSQIDYSQVTPPVIEREEEETPDMTVQTQDTGKTFADILPWILTFAGLILGGALILFAERAWQKQRFLRLSPQEQFEKCLRRLLWIWARMGYPRTDEETLQELRDRIIPDWEREWSLLQKEEPWRKAMFLVSYQEYLYGNMQVSEAHVKELLAEEASLMEYLKEERKWLYLLAWLRA